MILPKFSQKLADFRPDFCRFLLPRQTAKALYTFAAAIAAASGMYTSCLLTLKMVNLILPNNVGEKFREVMSNTFGLQNWRFFQTASQQSSQQSNQLTEMIPLQRIESECPPNILTGTYYLHMFL